MCPEHLAPLLDICRFQQYPERSVRNIVHCILPSEARLLKKYRDIQERGVRE